MFGAIYTLSSSAPATDYSAITNGLGTAFQNLVTNTVSMAGVVLPIGISVFGIFMLIGFGKKLFSKITGGGH